MIIPKMGGGFPPKGQLDFLGVFSSKNLLSRTESPFAFWGKKHTFGTSPKVVLTFLRVPGLVCLVGLILFLHPLLRMNQDCISVKELMRAERRATTWQFESTSCEGRLKNWRCLVWRREVLRETDKKEKWSMQKVGPEVTSCNYPDLIDKYKEKHPESNFCATLGQSVEVGGSPSLEVFCFVL